MKKSFPKPNGRPDSSKKVDRNSTSRKSGKTGKTAASRKLVGQRVTIAVPGGKIPTKNSKIKKAAGAVAGATLGFITGNVQGAVAGGIAGYRAGGGRAADVTGPSEKKPKANRLDRPSLVGGRSATIGSKGTNPRGEKKLARVLEALKDK